MAITRTNGGAVEMTQTGREIDMFTVNLSGVETGYSAVDSDFEKLVLAIETIGSIELLGLPGDTADEFRVGITGSAATAGELQTLLAAAVATTTVAAFTF